MNLEAQRSGRESPLTIEVKRVLPGIVDDIRPGYEQNNFLSDGTKQLIAMALEVDPEQVASDLADNQKQYEALHTTEQKVRHFLTDRIAEEVATAVRGADQERERQALALFLKYKVLDLNPLG